MEIKKLIDEILEYQEILKLQIEKENHKFNGALSEKECVYNDINNYCDDNFEDWIIDDFVEYIQYLENLTQITSNILKGDDER